MREEEEGSGEQRKTTTIFETVLYNTRGTAATHSRYILFHRSNHKAISNYVIGALEVVDSSLAVGNAHVSNEGEDPCDERQSTPH